MAVKREQRDKAHDTRVCLVYGLQPGEYQKLYQAQGERCYICQRATGAVRRLAVDHDHAVGDGVRESVRGLLCKPCNRLLGHARDNPEFFERAAAYLRQPPAREVLK